MALDFGKIRNILATPEGSASGESWILRRINELCSLLAFCELRSKGEMDSEEIKKKRKDDWIEAWFAVEVMAIDKETTEIALKNHVERLSRAKDTFVYETKYSETKRVDEPLPNVKEGYSQVVELKLFAKDIYTLLSIVMIYGPSSVEILGPAKKEAKIDEMQSVCNLVSGLLHQFAAQGAGGIVISPGK